MTSSTPHRPTSELAHIRAQVEGFDEHWLRHLHWSLLGEDGGLARWRVRSPIATRGWLILRPRSDATEADFRRLDREFGFASHLHSAWALMPLAQLHTPEGPIVVFDDHGGQPLSSVADGQLSVERFLRLATAAAAAVASAHSHGIVHRDLKPAHLILGRDGKVRLSGFALARTLGEPAADTDGISGSLPYMSPEQAGRIHQVADERSDLYSLGVSFFELLTGHLPFTAHDPVAWLHQHVAVPAPPLAQWRSGLPTPLQRLLDRLLAKRPVDRPASARLLENELRQALSEWNEFGHLTGVWSAPRRATDLPAPADAGLLGRSQALNQLMEAALRLGRQQPGGAVLIAAAAGMGKTALVRELRRNLAGSHVLFASGKFEPGPQPVPYAAVADALGSLMVRLLGLEPEERDRWRDTLRVATAPHGQMLARLIPELQWLTGPLPPSNEPPAGDARLRLHNLFLRVVRLLSKPEHPLIVFFDDLHWLDAESLALLQALRREDFNHLLLVVTCRHDAEQAPPPYDRLVAHVQSLAVPLLQIELAPLSLADTALMVRNALHLWPAQADGLAGPLHQQAGGNPLFISQTLQVLGEQPPPYALADLPVARNVTQLLATRLACLPADTRQLLHTMALFGNRVTRAELALAIAVDEAALTPQIAAAVQAQLVREHHDGYSFCHDPAQDAARDLQGAAERCAEHARIAWRLTDKLPAETGADRRFRIAAQILQADTSPVPQAWRERFIDVLLKAAHDATDSAAAPFALDYLARAERLLAHPGEASSRGRRYEIAHLQARCLLLNAEYAEADRHIAAMLTWVDTPAALSSLYVLKSENLLLAGDYAGAVQSAINGLATLGLHVNGTPAEADAEQAWQALQASLGARAIESLNGLPALHDPVWAARIELLSCAVFPGSFIDPNLMFTLLCQIARLSIEHGVIAAGAQSFAWLGVSLAHRQDAHHEGLRWVQLALTMVEQRGYEERKASVLLALDQISVWLRPLPFALGCAEQALRHSLARDTPSMGCYANNHIVSNLLVMGAPLERILRQIDIGLGLAHNLAFVDSQNILYIQALYIRRLAGVHCSATPIPDREQMTRRMADCTMGMAQFWWHLFEGLLHFLEGQFSQAQRHMDQAWALSWAAPAHLHLIDLAFFSVLNATACLNPTADGLRSLEKPLERLRYWAGLNPKAFADRLDLAEAEVLRAMGHPLEALRLYDQSITRAIACGAVHIQGLAHELASRCHHALGLTVSTRAHQRQARDAWRRWGAIALAEQMETQFPYLQDQPAATRSSIDLPGGQEQLDRLSITKACQALSREIEIGELVKTLLSNTLIHAGASQAMLLLIDAGSLRVEAVGQAGHGGVEVILAPHEARPLELPLSLVRAAMRDRQSVALDSPDNHERFADDPYLLARHNGSRLCVPLLKQNEVIGALYLENALTPGVFNRARIDVLELLAAQAAISITTARLYSDLLEENRRRRESESTLRTSRTLLAIGQAVGRHGSFAWQPSLDPAFWSPELFAQLRLVAADAPLPRARRQALAQHVHPDDRGRFEQVLQQAATTPAAFGLDFRVIGADGDVHDLQALAEPDGETGYLGVIFDVTERRRTETALRSARAELVRISQATVMGELAASIAHEINQPLGSILANAGAGIRWLERETPVVAEAIEGLRDIVKDGQRAADIVSALRSLARQSPPNRQALALDEVVRQVLALTREELKDRQVTAELAVCGPQHVLADGVQLQQVILNLINNAADAMQGLPAAARHLRLDANAMPGAVVLMVEDSGPGISEAQHQDIFKAFWTTKPSGMGMGLAICCSIIEAHGGRLLAATGRRGQTVMVMVLPV